MRNTLCVAALLAAVLAPAHAAVLDFGNRGATELEFCTSTNTGNGAISTCGNGVFIAQSYGDVAGVLDVRYSMPRFETSFSLKWWAEFYNDLYGVLWADSSDGDSQAAIDLVPAAGRAVTLQGLDLGSYSVPARNTTLVISDLGSGSVLYTRTGMVGEASNKATTFNFSNLSSTSGLRILWQDSAYNVGIDNIRYTVSAVPEPGAWLLMAGGLLAIGTLVRRRG